MKIDYIESQRILLDYSQGARLRPELVLEACEAFGITKAELDQWLSIADRCESQRLPREISTPMGGSNGYRLGRRRRVNT